MKIPVRSILYVAFFLSGGTSLVLEVCWFKELSYLLGNSLHAVASVAAGFMGGLCLGSVLAARIARDVRFPLRVYALLQLAIGLCGAVSIVVFRSTSPWLAWIYQNLSGEPGLFVATRFAVVLLLMLLPVTLMGMTLPVVVGASGRARIRYDLDAGGLYGVNTLGAVAGTMLASFLLVPGFGLLRTTLVIGIVDVCIGIMVFALHRGAGAALAAPPTEKTVAVSAGQPWMIGAAVAVAGAAGLILEVTWFRLLALTVGPTVHTFAVMLAVFLAGIGLGSVAEATVFRRWNLPGRTLLTTFLASAGLLAVLGLFYINHLPLWFDGLFRHALERFGSFSIVLSQVAISAVLIFPTALMLGAIFPAAVRAVRESTPGLAPETNVGLLYGANTAGAIFGSVAAGFWFLPRYGVRTTLILAAVAFLVTGLLLAVTRADRRRVWPVAAAAAACAVLLIAAPVWDTGLFNLGLYQNTYMAEPFDLEVARKNPLIFYEEGINTPVSVYNIRSVGSLRVSGKPDASTAPIDLDTQLLGGHLPMLWANRQENVALIGYGSGMTAAAILTHDEVRSLRIVELEPGVIHASPFFESINHGALSDPRVDLLLEDGRTHLAYTALKYDVIISEPSNPWMAGVANLFSRDFYMAVRERLAEGGLFGQHLQNYQLSEETYRGVLASLSDVFEHVVLFRTAPNDSILLASASPVSVPWETFAARARETGVSDSLLAIDVTSPLELPFFLQIGDETVRKIVDQTDERNTDDNVWLEYRLPTELFRQWNIRFDKVPEWIARTGSDSRLQSISAALPGIPPDQAVRHLIRYPNSREPVDVTGRISSDPWQRTRAILAGGLIRELRTTGQEELAARAEGWEREGDARREAAVELTRRLQQAVRSGAVPGAGELERALEAAPGHPMATMLLAMSLAETDRARAVELLQGLVNRPFSPLSYDAMLQFGRLAEIDGKTDAARGWYRRAIAQNQYRVGAYMAVMVLEMRGGNHKAAETAGKAGLRFNPTSEELLRGTERATEPEGQQ